MGGNKKQKRDEEVVFAFVVAGRGRVRYAQVDDSHPVGAKDESVTGCTCFVERLVPLLLEEPFACPESMMERLRWVTVLRRSYLSCWCLRFLFFLELMSMHACRDGWRLEVGSIVKIVDAV
jgi:hypothetical protein